MNVQEGYVPGSVDLSHMKGEKVDLPKNEDNELPSLYTSLASILLLDDGSQDTYEPPNLFESPLSYDLRALGRVTGMRNQGSSGCCWAFATIGSLESTLMPEEHWNFSENNMKNNNGYDIGPNDGGNELMSAAYLVRWNGPVNETDDPYVASSTTSPTLPAKMHVQEVFLLPARANSTDNENIKQAIMNYGAVFSAFWWSTSYYNSANISYYDPNFNGANHAIAIVGWDDSYSRNRFTSKPPGDGAFIIKNSWGTSFGDGGYFYMSYYDDNIGYNNAVYTAESVNNYKHIYQYDWLGWTSNYGYGSNTAWFAANYTAAGQESLSAVGFYTPALNSQYQIRIFKNNAQVSTQSGTIPAAGYHTVVLDSPTPLNQNDKFQVQVRLYTPSYNNPIAIERPISGFSSRAIANASETFVSSNGVAWSDMNTVQAGSSVCLKAYTNDASPTQGTVQFSTASAAVNENSGNATVSVARTGDTSSPVSVSYAVTGGTATAGTDYTGGSGTLNFAAGASTASFNISITNDAIYENNETVVVALSSPVSATLGTPSSTTITILNDDPAPAIRFSTAAYSFSENAGTVTIPVTLSGTTSLPASINYAVTGGNATAGTDYTGGSGTINFAAGTTSTSFNITIANDAIYENNETIVIALSSPANATAGTPSSTTITITDNDAAPVIQFGAATYSVNENAGMATIPVTLTGTTSLPSSINYAVTGGTATAGSDYTGGSGTLSFAAGTTTVSFNISIINDATLESSETIILTLSNPKNATTGTTGSATVTIVDDDSSLPTTQFASAAYSASENSGTLAVSVSRSGSVSLPASVGYAVTGGTATAGTDYTGGSGTLNFAAGASTASFSVTIANDAAYENNETIVVALSSPVNATLGTPSSTTITIVDNDAAPVIRFNAAAYSFSENTGTVTIPVTLSGTTSLLSSINYAVTGGNATAGTDYTGGSGTLNFAAGTTSASINITIANDAIYENNETIVLSFSAPVNATIGAPSSTTITIVNNDAAPVIQFGAATYSVNENAGMATIPVTLTGTTSLPSSINYAVTGGTATAGSDYTGGSGTINFAAGTTSASFNISITNDAMLESNETIILTLSNPKNATTGTRSSTTITIIDNDGSLPGTTSYDLTFVQGWNLISLPITPGDNRISGIFSAGQQANIDVIWEYRDGSWLFWTTEPGYTNQFDVLNTSSGYYFYCYSPMTVRVNGTAADGPISMSRLDQGWNLIGFPSTTAATVSSAYGTADVIWKMENGNWQYWTTEPGYTNQFDTMTPGLGYWVYKL